MGGPHWGKGLIPELAGGWEGLVVEVHGCRYKLLGSKQSENGEFKLILQIKHPSFFRPI